MLDEPTNHLDLISREALEDALSEFNGTVFVISHDRYLINKLADKLLVFEDGTIREYKCSYDDYLARKESAGETKKEISSSKAEKINDYKAQKETERAKRMRASRLARLEEKIEATESEIAAVTDEINGCGSDYVKLLELNERLDGLNTELDSLMEEWEKLESGD
ncbi:MAG: hypothetical protein LUG52_01355 [Clostridia bacterium]|nr:hypothetical protein [Clostridia bacterium]